MAATVTASIASLILTLDDPGRDDLDSVIVWCSTTSGFTPGAGNLVFQGKSLKIAIPNLTPSTTYYVKYAYVSQIDTTDYVVSAQLSGVPYKVGESLIDDGAISVAKFAAGIEPIEIVSTLPSAGNFQGRTVFLTTDNKLYRYNGTAFVSTVPTADLTGQITTTQITDDAITTAKIAANAITATELAASSVIAGKIAAAAISTTELAAGAVTAAKIATGTITANEIAANAITATELAADAVTADKIQVNALRGKTLASGVVIDGGSTVTTAVSKPTNVATTTTVNLDDTSDFPTAGGAIVISRVAAFNVKRQFRYTGKTATALTGVSGLQNAISVGDIVIPQPLPSFTLDSYTVGDPLDTSATAEFLFRSGSGSGISISPNRVADLFTYTAGHTLTGGVYTSVLAGVSGLAAFSLASGSRATIIDAVSLVTTTVAATGTVTSLTISAATSYLRSGGGKLLLASTTVTGVKKVNYTAYSGTTITIDGGVYLTAATYYVIPLFAYNVIGSDLYSLINYNNSYNGEWQRTHISSDIELSNDISEGYEISPSVGYGLKIWPSSRASELDTAGLFIGTPAGTLHQELQPIPFNDIDTAWMYSGFFGSMFIGAASGVGSYADNVLVSYDGSNLNQYQPISATLRFSNYNAANVDAITFNETKNTYSFGADGSTANATIAAQIADIGNGNIYTSQNTNAKTVADATVGAVLNQFVAWNANSVAPSVSLGNQVSSSSGNEFNAFKARGGNTTAITAAVNGDNMAFFRGYLYDGAAWQLSASIKFEVDATVAAGDAPGRIVFSTTPDGSSTHTERMQIDNAGDVFSFGGGRIGYGAGSGGVVTQATSRTTGVTLNSSAGRITLVSAAGSTSWTSFTVTNSKVATSDVIVVNQRTGSNLYEIHVTAVAAGSFQLSFRTTGGTATEAPTISFAIIRGANS